MRKLNLYIATSFNGKIAKLDGNVDWLENLPNPDKLDYGYYDFYDSIDTTIMGNNTYRLLLSWDVDFPYANKKNYVFTRNAELQNDENVDYISEDHLEFIKKLKEQPGKDIWLIGGGQLVTLLFNAGLIDELWVHLMPIVLEDGLPLFHGMPKEQMLELIETKSYPTGVVELRYGLSRK